MKVCQTLGSPVANHTLIEAACGKRIYGRYLYISLIRDTAYDGYFQLYEVDVCMGKYLHEMNIVHYVTFLHGICYVNTRNLFL